MSTPTKWVYLFHEGNAQMRDTLGGKGPPGYALQPARVSLSLEFLID